MNLFVSRWFVCLLETWNLKLSGKYWEFSGGCAIIHRWFPFHNKLNWKHGSFTKNMFSNIMTVWTLKYKRSQEFSSFFFEFLAINDKNLNLNKSCTEPTELYIKFEFSRQHLNSQSVSCWYDVGHALLSSCCIQATTTVWLLTSKPKESSTVKSKIRSFSLA